MNEYKKRISELKLSESGKDDIKKLYQKKKKHNMWLKPVVAVAACMALILSVTQVMNRTNDGKTASHNSFTVMVNAAQVSGTSEVIAKTLGGSGFNETGDKYEEAGIAYDIQMALSCTGKNIKKITYSINRGAFQISRKKSDTSIVSAKEHKGDNNYPGTIYKDGSGVPSFYSSFTVNYDNQPGKHVHMSVAGWYKGKTIAEEYFGAHDRIGWQDVKKTKKAADKIFKDVVITCKVTYKDGTTQEKKIGIKGKIMTWGDAFPEEKNDPAIPKNELNEKYVFYAFYLK